MVQDSLLKRHRCLELTIIDHKLVYKLHVSSDLDGTEILVGVKQLAQIFTVQKCAKMELSTEKKTYLKEKSRIHDEMKPRVLNKVIDETLDKGGVVKLVVGSNHPKAEKSVKHEMQLEFKPDQFQQEIRAEFDLFILYEIDGKLRGSIYEIKSYPLHKFKTFEYVQTLLYTLLLSQLLDSNNYSCKFEQDVTICEREFQEGKIKAMIRDREVAKLFRNPIAVEGYLVAKSEMEGEIKFIGISTINLNLTPMLYGRFLGTRDKFIVSTDCKDCIRIRNGTCTVFYTSSGYVGS